MYQGGVDFSTLAKRKRLAGPHRDDVDVDLGADCSKERDDVTEQAAVLGRGCGAEGERRDQSE